MENPFSATPASDASSSTGAASAWHQRLLVVALALVIGVCVGVAAGALHASGMSRVVLQSLAGGVLVGVVLIGGAASARLRPPRWPAALTAGVVAVATEHYWLYTVSMDARRAATVKQPAVELFRPGWSEQSFWEFLHSEATTQAMTLWAVDACLLALAAVVIVEWNANRPSTRDV